MGTMAMAKTEFCTTNIRPKKQECRNDRTNGDVSGDGSFGGDPVLSSWMKDNGIVLSQTPSSRGVKSTGPHIGTGTIGPVPATNYLLTWPNLVTNIEPLESVAAGIGVVASAPQPDNQTRTYPLAIGVEGKIYPSFAIEMIRTYTQQA